MLALIVIFVSWTTLSPGGGSGAPPGAAAEGRPAAARQDKTQETRPAHAANIPLQREGPLLENLLTEVGRDGQRGAGIDSLLRAHPELRQLVLCKLLTPDEPQTLVTAGSLFTREGWRLEGNAPMTPFERMSLIKSRQMILHDRWTENRILAPQVDLLGTVLWLLSLIR